jgi:ribA/ribD-fused uncharacterized protein
MEYMSRNRKKGNVMKQVMKIVSLGVLLILSVIVPHWMSAAAAGPSRASGAQWKALALALKRGDKATVASLVPNPIEPWRAMRNGHTALAAARFEAGRHQYAPHYMAVVRYLEPFQPGAGRGAAAGGGGFAHQGGGPAGGGFGGGAAYAGPGLSADEQKMVAAGGPIEFYDKGRPFYWLTNFGEIPGGMFIGGFNWPTTEHYFQAQKFTDPRIINEIQRARGSREVFDLANSKTGKYNAFIRPDWQQAIQPFGGRGGNLVQTRADAVMMRGLVEKFKNPALGAKLIATKNADLIEASPHDPYWGWGPQRNGQNKLGRMLGYVRWAIQNGQIGQIEAELKQRGF